MIPEKPCCDDCTNVIHRIRDRVKDQITDDEWRKLEADLERVIGLKPAADGDWTAADLGLFGTRGAGR